MLLCLTMYLIRVYGVLRNEIARLKEGTMVVPVATPTCMSIPALPLVREYQVTILKCTEPGTFAFLGCCPGSCCVASCRLCQAG